MPWCDGWRDDEKATVGGDVVASRPIRLHAVDAERRREQRRRLAGFARRTALNRDRHQLPVESQVVQLTAVGAPLRLQAALRRDLPLPLIGIGKRLDDDLI
jgi:hypothetical protein